jgi:alpha-mannosidase
MDLYGIGDHGGGPTRAMLDEGFHWAAPGHVTPKFEFGLAQPYFDELSGKIASNSPVWDYRSIARGYTPPPPVPGKVAIPTWKSEMYFEYHRGVMTTQANHKKNMRDSEEEVLNAEKWASLAWLHGNKYPADEITEDWKKVLFNQFHDLAAGSGIGIIYKDAQKDYDVVRYSTSEISSASLQTLGEHINTAGNGVPVVVYNPLGWERSGEVTAHVQGAKETLSATGAQVVQAKTDEKAGVSDVRLHVLHVPALGYKVVWVGTAAKGKQAAGNDVTANQSGNAITLENATLRVSVDKQTDASPASFRKNRTSKPWPPAPAATSCSSSKTRPRTTTPGTSIPELSMQRRKLLITQIRSNWSIRPSPAFA